MKPSLSMYWLKLSDKSITTKPLQKSICIILVKSRNSVFSSSSGPRLLRGGVAEIESPARDSPI
jgi:hypothetical protein